MEPFMNMIEQLRNNLHGAFDECLHAHHREGSTNPATGKWVNDAKKSIERQSAESFYF